MFSIGEFSKLTGLTVKTLRYYHEQKLLEPTRVDCGTGYRFYDVSKVELAHSINALRKLGFSIAEIQNLLNEHADDSTMLAFLETRRSAIQAKIESDRATLKLLDSIIAIERQTAERIGTAGFEITEKEVQPTLVASVRHTGKYDECGKLFGKIGRRFGRHLSGKPMLLCHDDEYRDADANFEVAFPIRKGDSKDGIKVYELAGGKAISLMHPGPYGGLHRSYARLIEAANERNLTYRLPSQEIYEKGPGILFRGNPDKYLTEIRLMLADDQP